jgi:DNA polymerase III delta subunit
MLYFLYGDIPKASEKARDLVNSLLLKQPDAARFKIDSQNWQTGEMEGLLHGQGLFSQRYIIEFRHLLEESEISDSVISFLPEIAQSENIFIWMDRDVTDKHLKEIKKHAAKVQEFTVAKKIDNKPAFNLFSLGDALIERNKQKLWVLFQDALNYSVVEEIHGTLFWQMKNMVLVNKVQTAAEADLKPFVFSKAKSALKKYSEKEIENMFENLLAVSHDARRGKHDFRIALEKWILSI